MEERDRSTANITRLADIHITRYHNRIRQGHLGYGNIRVGECQIHLSIWESIAEKQGVWDALSDAERREVMDAIDSGE